MTAVVAVDLGKTGCRAALCNGSDGPPRQLHEVPGAPGLAADGGVAAARAAVLPLLERERPARPAAVCAGAAGAAAAPRAASALACLLLEELPTDEVAVTGDAVTAHAGALGGRTGVERAIGAGSVAVGIGDDGSYARVDGWGPWFGDEGGGARIGAAGLRAPDGRDPDTRLLAAAVERFGAQDRLPVAIGRDGTSARTAPSFAPDVARLAAAGDTAASAIIRDAATALAEAVLAAARRSGGEALSFAVTGGLTSLGEPLLGPLRSAPAGFPRPLRPRSPLGRPLDGARLLALDARAPHEPHVVRVRRAAPSATVPTSPVPPPAVA
ncbi:BadF/BadG/BcrA/BcrD ATPase family protein [Streptomyces sp. NPDC052301]|uniref:BadF/BadG/BcrA/BcrD ATPase family protein n=1 Tax=Streptomyces sp. NPDC052301 TaxID=3365687 RepID=UPI0037D60974